MSPDPWWAQFFDDEYLRLYGPSLHAARTEAEVAGVCALLGLREGQRVLDLCCGDGRHAVGLQRRGLRVTGVDLSASLLRHARARAERVLGGHDDDGNPTDPEGPVFVRADARALPVAARYDAVVLLFNSIGYGTDADTLAMLQQARAAGRQLLVECVHRDREVRDLVASDRANGVETERWIDPVEGVAHAVFRSARGERRFRHRLYTATELKALVLQAGFTQFAFFGDYAGTPFRLDSPLLLVRAS